jgi:formiminotetrahydrofolate cyclodeaminase
MTALTQGNKDGVKAAGKLFADEGFQNLLIESATRGTPSKATINKAANSQSFKRFADAVKLPKSVDQRIQYLESALQSGRNIEENQ